PGPLGRGLGLGETTPGPVEVGQQVPGLGQPKAVAETVEGGDGQLDLVAALAQEQPRVVDGGDAETADGRVQGQALVADRGRRAGQLLVGPGCLGELAAGLLGLGQRGQGGQPQRGVGREQRGCPAQPGRGRRGEGGRGGQPQRVVGREQRGCPAQPGLDQRGVAADGGALAGGGVALAGPAGPPGPPAAGRGGAAGGG